jgi:hypothetical protein
LKRLSSPECLREILDRMGALRPDVPRRWGKMNAHQMVCHLADSFLGPMGRRHVSSAAKEYGPLMKCAALYLPMHWPRGVPTMPEVDQEKFGTMPADFAADLQRAMALTEEFARQPHNFSFAPHPMFRQMKHAEWMRWGYLHADHHLRQFGV